MTHLIQGCQPPGVAVIFQYQYLPVAAVNVQVRKVEFPVVMLDWLSANVQGPLALELYKSVNALGSCVVSPRDAKPKLVAVKFCWKS